MLFGSGEKTLSDESIVLVEMEVNDFVSILAMDPLQLLLLYHPLFSKLVLQRWVGKLCITLSK